MIVGKANGLQSYPFLKSGFTLKSIVTPVPDNEVYLTKSLKPRDEGNFARYILHSRTGTAQIEGWDRSDVLHGELSAEELVFSLDLD